MGTQETYLYRPTYGEYGVAGYTFFDTGLASAESVLESAAAHITSAGTHETYLLKATSITATNITAANISASSIVGISTFGATILTATNIYTETITATNASGFTNLYTATLTATNISGVTAVNATTLKSTTTTANDIYTITITGSTASGFGKVFTATLTATNISGVTAVNATTVKATTVTATSICGTTLYGMYSGVSLDHGALSGLSDNDHPQYTQTAYVWDHGTSLSGQADNDHTQYPLTTQVWDHGTALSGLTDDDHTQYVLANGTRALSNVMSGTSALFSSTISGMANLYTATLTAINISGVTTVDVTTLKSTTTTATSIYTQTITATNASGFTNLYTNTLTATNISGVTNVDTTTLKSTTTTATQIYAETLTATTISGVATIIVQNGGNVGIGTTSPSVLVEVEGPSAVDSGTDGYASLAKITGGSAANPITAVTPMVSIRRREAITQDGQGGQNSALYVESYGDNTSVWGGTIAQVNALTAKAYQIGTGDVVGVYGTATQSGGQSFDNGYTAYASFFAVLANTDKSGAVAIGTDINNSTGVDQPWPWTFGLGESIGLDLVASGPGLITAGISLRSNAQEFDVGMGAKAGSIHTAFLQDDSDSINVLTVTGSHAYGIDLFAGTFSGAAIRVGNSKTESAIKIGDQGHIIGRNSVDGSLWVGGGQDKVYIDNNMTVAGTLDVQTTGATDVNIAKFLQTNSGNGNQTYMFIGQGLASGRAGVIGFTDNTDGVSGATWITNYGDDAGAGVGLFVKKGGNVGIGTATFGASAVRVLAIGNGTPPAAHTDDQIYVYSVDSSDAAATLGLMLEQAVEDGAPAAISHKIKVWINGTEYWIGLDAV